MSVTQQPKAQVWGVAEFGACLKLLPACVHSSTQAQVCVHESESRPIVWVKIKLFVIQHFVDEDANVPNTFYCLELNRGKELNWTGEKQNIPASCSCGVQSALHLKLTWNYNINAMFLATVSTKTS